MKEYEVIWEIFNKCPRNQMRDVFVEEVEIADPEAYVKQKFQWKAVAGRGAVLRVLYGTASSGKRGAPDGVPRAGGPERAGPGI